MSEFVLILGLQAVDTRTAVELTPKHLICLNEALQLARQISILALEALSVLFKSISFGKQVTVVCTVLCGRDSEAFDIASDGKELVLLLLQPDLTISDLDRNVRITAFLKVYLLSEVIVLSGYALVVPS